jgi:hypothetical protein
MGHDALPLACRQFPRVTLHDPRGASVTLSHYCPTAAALLDEDAPVSIVTGAGAFPPDGEYVGLDARTSLPPLLRANVLMDWDAWFAWEEASVDVLANSDAPAGVALARLGVAVEHVRTWRPGSETLGGRVGEAFRLARLADPPVHHDWTRRVVEVIDAIPPGTRGRYADRVRLRTSEGTTVSPGEEKRFLAAHAFANWTAHLGLGLRSWLRSIEAASALLHAGFDVRSADLLLRHLADTDALTRIWATAEDA